MDAYFAQVAVFDYRAHKLSQYLPMWWIVLG